MFAPVTRIRRPAMLVGALAVLGLVGCGEDSTAPPVEPTPTSNVALLYAGVGQPGLGDDGVGPRQAQFYYPMDVTFGPTGIPYILDWNNHRVRSLEGGSLSTVLGTGYLGDATPGPAMSVALNHPTHISFDPLGRMIVSAWHNSKVMRMDLAVGTLDNFCGDGRRLYTGDDIPANTATLNLPSSTAFDAQGRMYISDQENQLIRRIELDGTITRVAGYVTDTGAAGQAGFSGDGGPATQAKLFSRGGQAADPQMRLVIGPDQNLYFCDSGNNRVRKVDLTTGVITTVAGNGGLLDFAGDGGPATAAILAQPCDLEFGPDGNLYIADTFNHCIRKVDMTTGIITTAVGIGKQRSSAAVNGANDGLGVVPTQARLYRPYGLTFGADGRLYIADTFNNRIVVVIF